MTADVTNTPLQQVIFGLLTLLSSAGVILIIQSKPWRKRAGDSLSDGNLYQTATADRHSRIRILVGFIVSILASITWAVGNVLSRYTASVYSGDIGAIVDISLANYVSGSLFIAGASALYHWLTRDPSPLLPRENMRSKKLPYGAAFFKASNTYLFVAAVMFVNAAIATTLENLHVLWTAVAVSLIGKSLLDRSWFISALLLTTGSVLILRFWDQPFETGLDLLGVGFAILAGISLALFIVFWNEHIGDEGTAPQRAMQTAIFLGMTTIMLCVFGMCLCLMLSDGKMIPFSHISSGHLLLQLLNGLFNIGVTYFLMAEALRLMKPVGQIASFLLALGISSAVLFTLLIEALISGKDVLPVQWIGAFLFSVGFAITKENLSKSTNNASRPSG